MIKHVYTNKLHSIHYIHITYIYTAIPDLITEIFHHRVSVIIRLKSFYLNLLIIIIAE